MYPRTGYKGIGHCRECQDILQFVTRLTLQRLPNRNPQPFLPQPSALPYTTPSEPWPTMLNYPSRQATSPHSPSCPPPAHSPASTPPMTSPSTNQTTTTTTTTPSATSHTPSPTTANGAKPAPHPPSSPYPSDPASSEPTAKNAGSAAWSANTSRT